MATIYSAFSFLYYLEFYSQMIRKLNIIQSSFKNYQLLTTPTIIVITIIIQVLKMQRGYISLV